MRPIRTPRTASLVVCALLLSACATDDEAAPDDEVQDEDGAQDGPEDDGEDAAAGDPDATEDADDDAEDANADADGEGTEVSVVDNAFDPEAATITVGETVIWTHDGDITHNVVADDDTFASDNLAPGESFEHTFDEAGTFEYLCTIHGQAMSGTVEVED